MPFHPNHHERDKQIERITTRWEKERDLLPLNIDLIRASGQSKATFYRKKKKFATLKNKDTPPNAE